MRTKSNPLYMETYRNEEATLTEKTSNLLNGKTATDIYFARQEKQLILTGLCIREKLNNLKDYNNGNMNLFVCVLKIDNRYFVGFLWSGLPVQDPL